MAWASKSMADGFQGEMSSRGKNLESENFERQREARVTKLLLSLKYHAGITSSTFCWLQMSH